MSGVKTQSLKIETRIDSASVTDKQWVRKLEVTLDKIIFRHRRTKRRRSEEIKTLYT